MRHRASVILLLTFCTMLYSPVLFAQKRIPDNVEILSVRMLALGGLHSALADDNTTLLSNPAGFKSVEPQVTVAGFTLGIYGQTDDIAEEVLTGTETGAVGYTYSNINLLGPIALSYVGNGFGFGIFNTSNIRSYEPNPANNTKWTIIEENIIFSGGYAFRIPTPAKWQSTLDFGFLLRAFITGQSLIEKDIQEVYQSFSDPLGLISNEAFNLIPGVGINFGFLYTYKETFSIGLAGRDLAPFSINSYTSFQSFLNGDEPDKLNLWVPLDLSLGIFWRPQLDRVGRYITDFRLMLDYQDMIDFLTYPYAPTHPLLHISLGCELQLLEIVYLRAGFYHLLPGAGFGLDLSLFSLSMALFGRELSSEPWGNPFYNFAIGMEFKY